jgi:RHH-type transcriptional regulator, proline utilization regulon repressor / proline dehydrogenase / delta 1-pyrroline-5-carboxylate dehydrogenase
MIVDSTALPEQAVRDIVASAFQSAGQRCSALRMLYVQDDIAANLLTMLFGAMDELRLGDPWEFSTDIGPVIDAAAHAKIAAHIDAAARDGRVLKKLNAPAGGLFIGPTVLQVTGIADLAEEIFGPVLHIATFAGGDIDRVIDDINRSGYGLTFGLHTRIDSRVQRAIDRVRAGNIYVNRNQIGAVVGSQPFGGEGLSGTGPKAGGPHYLPRFRVPAALSPMRAPPLVSDRSDGVSPPVKITAASVADALAALPPAGDTQIAALSLPGPTGESNRLCLYPRGVVLCLGPTAAAAAAQVDICRAAGCAALAIAPGVTDGLDGSFAPPWLRDLAGIDAVVFWGEADPARGLRRALAARDGPLVPLICDRDIADRLMVERHVCVDITASGGNASLLAAGAG